MTRPKDSGYTIIEMVRFMKVIGLIIFRVDRESKHGLIGVGMRESTSWGRSMGKVLMFGLMVVTILDLGRITTYTDMGSIFGVMGEAIRVSGVLTRCMDMECIYGKMGVAMKENTIMIRNTVSVNINGQMVAVSRGIG